MRKFVLIIILSLTLVTSTSASISTSPEDFATTFMNQILVGQYDRVYTTLIPDQRKLVSQSRFMDCLLQQKNESLVDMSGATISDVKVVDIYRSKINIPGTKRNIVTTALTLRYTIHLGKDSDSWSDTFHLVKHGNSWYWMTDGATLRDSRTGNCS